MASARNYLDLSPIRPVSDLQKRFSEIEALAAEGPVRLTKNGKGAYLLFDEATLQRMVEDIVEDVRYEFEILEGVRRGVEDIEAGRCHTLDEALELMDELRSKRDV